MHLIFDTDIGTDVDDALALAVLLGSDEITIDLITTVYGDTRLRARLASRLISISGTAKSIPVAAGLAETRSKKPVWWPGHEGALHTNLDHENIDTTPGVDAIAQHIQDGARTILAVGPLANIAALLDRYPREAAQLDRIVIMGGDFSTERVPEHNILSDITAAQRVAASELPLVIGGLDLTTQIALDHHHVDRISNAGPLGGALRDEIAQWWTFHGHEWNNPHDPILAAYLLEPRLFTTELGRLEVSDDGRTWFTPDHTGSVTRLVDLDRRAVAELIVERIQQAGAPADNAAAIT
jgi:purine nucleosidase